MVMMRVKAERPEQSRPVQRTEIGTGCSIEEAINSKSGRDWGMADGSDAREGGFLVSSTLGPLERPVPGVRNLQWMSQDAMFDRRSRRVGGEKQGCDRGVDSIDSGEC
jgi:hypothetical protein